MACLDEVPKRNAPSGKTGGAQDTQTKRHGNSTIKTAQKQPLPLPGTCLTAYLSRYRRELLDCEPSRDLSLAMDCVDGLLMLMEARQ